MESQRTVEYHNDVPYSDYSSLNTLNVCVPAQPSAHGKSRVWVVYIHGGAWRDPLITASSFTKTQSILLSSSISDSIAGLATLNYRLSPHPNHPWKSDTDRTARNAKHPDHINDILDALAFLQRKYRFGDRYVLAGHSCGAMLALQVAMSRSWSADGPAPIKVGVKKQVMPPLAVLGLEGLYDLPALVEYHASRPHGDIYTAFTNGAFGSDVHVWKAVSPTSADWTADVVQGWDNGRVAVLAHSHEDELVEWEQVALMQKALQEGGWQEGEGGKEKGRELVMLTLEGTHHGVWEEGTEVARAIAVAVEKVIGLEGGNMEVQKGDGGQSRGLEAHDP